MVLGAFVSILGRCSFTTKSRHALRITVIPLTTASNFLCYQMLNLHCEALGQAVFFNRLMKDVNTWLMATVLLENREQYHLAQQPFLLCSTPLSQKKKRLTACEIFPCGRPYVFLVEFGLNSSTEFSPSPASCHMIDCGANFSQGV